MESILKQAGRTSAEPVLSFDRASGKLSGAGLMERGVVQALHAGSVLTTPFGHRGYGLGCKAVSAAVSKRDIVINLNSDAVFAVPLCDGYWSRLLNERYHYEEEIEALLKSAADIKYLLVD